MPADLHQSYRIDPADLPGEAVIFGHTPAMRTVRRKIEQILEGDYPVLIQGEYGTGKDLIARFLHAHSLRCKAPFVKVNCGAVPAGRLEADLLGSEIRAASGAVDVHPGIVEDASGGSLFLEEIDKMDLGVQARLLAMLETGTFRRIGGQELKPLNVRIVCASHGSLAAAVNRGAFRRDLFYRIDGICLQLPALRDRAEDFPQLWEFLAARLAGRFGRTVPRMSLQALDTLRRLKWPGNLRELENCAARVIILGEKEAIAAELRRQTALGAPAESTLQRSNRRRRGSASSAGHLSVLPLRKGVRPRLRKIVAALKRSPRPRLYRCTSPGTRRRLRSRREFPRSE
jgi:DNA-binding NtrC family response regulator